MIFNREMVLDLGDEVLIMSRPTFVYEIDVQVLSITIPS